MSGTATLGVGTLGAGGGSSAEIFTTSSTMFEVYTINTGSTVTAEPEPTSRVIITGSVHPRIELYGTVEVLREPEDPPSTILFPSEDPALPPPPEFDIADRADLVIKRVSIVMPHPYLNEKGQPQ